VTFKRYGWVFNDDFTENLQLSVLVKEFVKSVNISQSIFFLSSVPRDGVLQFEYMVLLIFRLTGYMD